MSHDLRYTLRWFRRSPAFAAALLVVLALGFGASATGLTLSVRGIRHIERAAAVGEPLSAAMGHGLDLAEVTGLSLEPQELSSTNEDLRSVRSIGLLRAAALRTLLRAGQAISWLIVALAAVGATVLLLARANARRGEIGVRSALGATRTRLLRQLASEGAAVYLAGGGAGLLLALTLIPLLRSGWPAALPQWLGWFPDGAAAAGAAVLFLFTLAAALAPLALVLETGLRSALTGAGRVTSGRAEGDIRRLLVVIAVACSLVLMTAAGLLLRAFAGGAPAEALGFDPRDTLTLRLELPPAYDPAGRAALLAALLQNLDGVPGAHSASVSSNGAWEGLGTTGTVNVIVGGASRPGEMNPGNVLTTARHHAISPGFFRSMGGTVVRGREFTAADGRGAPPTLLINQTFANRFFYGKDPLGKTVQLGGATLGERSYVVVGLVEDIRAPGLGTGGEPDAALYLSALRHPPSSAAIAVRTSGDPMQLAPAVEAAIRNAGPGSYLGEIMPMTERLAQFAAPVRWFAAIFAAMAAAAVLLALVAIAGAVSFDVARRRREIGIRMAVGAGARRIVREVVGSTLRTVGAGALIGLLAALPVARLLQRLFSGIDPLDPAVYSGMAALLAAVGIAASLGPALRAARTNPAITLQAE